MPRTDVRDRVTLDDVAARAGVSKGTVSKTLNARSDVSESTRRRVLAVVAELGYRPTTRPAGPTRTRVLVAVADSLGSHYISHVLQGVVAAAAAERTDVLVRLAPDRAVRNDPATARAWVEDQLVSGAVGAVGITLGEPTALLAAAAQVNLPFVIIDPVDVPADDVVRVGATNWAGGRTAAGHLIGLGHRRIAWIGGPESSEASVDRFHGYAAALETAGIGVNRSLLRHGPFSVETGLTHGRDLLGLPEPPTAVLCGDDEIAVGVLLAARELGVPVPQGVSVVGFDDTPQARWTAPPLTTVHQPLEGMGRMAVQTVLTLAEGDQPASRQVQLVTTLVERGSTAPPA